MTESGEEFGPGKTGPDVDVEGFVEGDPLEQLIEERTPGAEGDGANTSAGHVRARPDQMDFLQRMSWPSDTVTPNEEIVEASNPSWWRGAGAYFLGSVFCGLALGLAVLDLSGHLADVLNWFLPLWFSVESIPSWFPRLMVLLFVFGAVIIGAEHLRRKFIWYILTDRRIIIRRRLLSRSIQDVEYGHIQKAEQKDPVPLRWVGVGHVYIYTAGTDGWEAELSMVKNPSSTKSIITKRASQQFNENSPSARQQQTNQQSKQSTTTPE